MKHSARNERINHIQGEAVTRISAEHIWSKIQLTWLVLYLEFILGNIQMPPILALVHPSGATVVHQGLVGGMD